MQLLIASHNVHKIRELRELLKALPGLDVLSLVQFPEYVPLPETGKTFRDNAEVKAEHAAKFFKMWTLGEDSGLTVPTLDGAPGLFSRRYAGETASDADNRKKLLHALQGKSGLERHAHFECALALATPDGILKKCVTGNCEGYLLTEERGNKGFGYDSLFVKHDYDLTFGELDESIKNRISHRQKATEKMLLTLESLLREV